MITGQNTLSTSQNTGLMITLADLTVTNTDNIYPTGFSLTVMAGTNYTLVGNTITPATDFTGILTVPVKVNDGAADSNIYNLSVSVTAPTGTTYYVDNTNGSCSDAGAGTTSSLPFCTMGKGATVSVAGDTVRVLAGTCTPKPSNRIPALRATRLHSSSAAPGVIVTGVAGNSTNGGAFRITSKSYIVVDSFNVTGTADYGIILDTSNHITISNNHVSYSGTSSVHKIGIYLRATTDSIVSGNTTDHNTMDGIRLNTGSNYNTVSNNISLAIRGIGTQCVRYQPSVQQLQHNHS